MKRRNLLVALAAMPVMARAQALPPPRHGTPGLVRIAGTPQMAEVVSRWQRAFAASSPAIRVAVELRGSDVAMAALYTARSDIALIGREATKPEVQAFEWVYRTRPRSLPVLCGSIATPGKSPAIAALVHHTNPLAAISLDDLAAAIGDGARKVRSWGDLGRSGPGADRPINLYMPFAEGGTGRFLRSVLLADSNRLAWARMREFDVRPGEDASDAAMWRRMHDALARDPDGLALGAADFGSGAIKPLSLVVNGAPVSLDETSVVSGAYPLARQVNACFAADANGDVHAETCAFLDFVMSPAGQALGREPGGYLPLSADRARAGRAALPG